MDKFKKMKKKYYKKDHINHYNNGIINFSPNSMYDLDSEDIKSYDEYLDIQSKSAGKNRKYFEMCFYEGFNCYFKGEIAKVSSTNILFKRIFIDGMYNDGTGFFGKEDHVWLDINGFEEFEVGYRLKFSAEIYRYIKKGNGKMLDYSLRNPAEITIIPSYEVPTDEELINQQIEQLVCETCVFINQCFMGNCIANKKQREETINFLKQLEPGRFTEHTVLAAYEIAGQVATQITGGEIDKNNPKYEIINKILTEANSRNAGCIWPLEQAIISIIMPEKPRMYI